MAFRVCTEVIIQCSTFCIKAVRDSQGFNKCGFPGTILADKEGYRIFKRELINPANSWYVMQEGMFRDFIPIDFKFADEKV